MAVQLVPVEEVRVRSRVERHAGTARVPTRQHAVAIELRSADGVWWHAASRRRPSRSPRSLPTCPPRPAWAGPASVRRCVADLFSGGDDDDAHALSDAARRGGGLQQVAVDDDTKSAMARDELSQAGAADIGERFDSSRRVAETAPA